jgi:hypothetical protein
MDEAEVLLILPSGEREVERTRRAVGLLPERLDRLPVTGQTDEDDTGTRIRRRNG